MLDRLSELIELFLVGLGQAISRLSAEEKTMITLLLSFLIVAAAAARALEMLRL
ncbi:MAG TPA: hypothetical protein VF865_13990 [Acidobacteriaceae bacterium]